MPGWSLGEAAETMPVSPLALDGGLQSAREGKITLMQWSSSIQCTCR